MAGHNKHGNFKEVQATRPDWSEDTKWKMSKTRNAEWQYGDGANDGGEGLTKKHVEIDPYQEGRPAAFNYKLLISAIVPRPIGFISTRSLDGSSTNLAPYSYTQVMCHDPPLFVVGVAGGLATAKDTLKNIIDTKECVINIISEHFIEAANSCSVPAPHGISEWSLSGLTPAKSTTVKPDRVKEAIFAVEGVLVDHKEYYSKTDPNKATVCILTIEGTRFWVREDALSKDQDLVDMEVLRPVARLGGISYVRQLDGFQLERPGYESTDNPETKALLKPKLPSQM